MTFIPESNLRVRALAKEASQKIKALTDAHNAQIEAIYQGFCAQAEAIRQDASTADMESPGAGLLQTTAVTT
jgi:hypothetical protein